jgi:hypothetical protein
MIRAVFKDGVLHPLDPPPSEWLDGRELLVEEAETTPEDLDTWYREVKDLVAKIDPGDPARIEAALKEQDAEAKAWMRREMGLD